jgi:uncharacterized membrane protein YgcG
VAGRRYGRVRAAVERAEAATGLQFCVYLGKVAGESPRELAERLFTDAAPDVLIAVVPSAHQVEILTAPGAQARVPDEACAAAIERMRPSLRRRRFDVALAEAVEHLAAVAGPGEATGPSLPDFFDESG